jgi:hypothetical protein
MRDDEGSAGVSENPAADVSLSFAAFVLAHVGCGDEVIELRVGERLLLEWCPVCAEMAAFGFSEGATTAPQGSTLA